MALFIVSTPIGNLKDISERAIETLSQVDEIICEDTRKTSILLARYTIKKPFIVLNDFNEKEMTPSIIQKLMQGKNLALVSDSGTPLISDPGFTIVKEAKKRGIEMTSIPGPVAFITALTLSGLPPDKLLFLGFLPKPSGKKNGYVKNLSLLLHTAKEAKLSPTVIFYESPHRIIETLQVMQKIFGDIEISLAKELTKIHETIWKDTISHLIEELKDQNIKGEFIILFNLSHQA